MAFSKLFDNHLFEHKISLKFIVSFTSIMKILIIIFLHFVLSDAQYTNFNLTPPDFTNKYGGNISEALVTAIRAIPLRQITLAFDNNTEEDVIQVLYETFIKRDMAVVLYNLTTPELQEKYFSFVSDVISNYHDLTTLFMCNRKVSEYILLEFSYRNFIRRNIYLYFYWGEEPVSRYFRRSLHEMLKTVVITNPRFNTYRLYYNQATSYKRHHLTMVNWWSGKGGLFHHPTLPAAKPIFQNFNEKLFNVPVLHKPPWFFVKYDNGTVEVVGGRDDMLLALLAAKLNFRYVYVDPTATAIAKEQESVEVVDEEEESLDMADGTIEGVLVQIANRETEFFLGDVTITLERLNLVEFSFLTLADSVAFVTHAPSRLNEALALVRPFNWEVWPAIIVTLIVSGVILYMLIVLPNTWQPRIIIRSRARVLSDCYWFILTLFLKQTGTHPCQSNKARFFTIILSLSTTYIIADMYSANLTSLLARPGREKAINTLVELERVMIEKAYKLYVESSTSSLLENGTGIYGRLWKMMTKRQRAYYINSVEEGVRLVSNSTNVAVIAGRETLYFDIQRFGAKTFHLSEKLTTAYSAIAFQIGAPYLENFNQIIMAIFEAGILTKMTENEYEKLGKKHTGNNTNTKNVVVPVAKKVTRKAAKADEESKKSQPITIKMLQGAFYLLFIGNTFAIMVLVMEVFYIQQQRNINKMQGKFNIKLKKLKRRIRYNIFKLIRKIRIWFYNMINEAIIETFEYLD